MPATSLAAPDLAAGLAFAPPAAEIAIPATTRTIARPAAPNRVRTRRRRASAATAARSAWRRCSRSSRFDFDIGVLLLEVSGWSPASLALRQGRRRPIPREAGEAKELRGRRRAGGADGEFEPAREARREPVDVLAGHRDGVQRERQHGTGRRAERGQLQPAAAEQGAAPEEVGEQRLAAA